MSERRGGRIAIGVCLIVFGLLAALLLVGRAVTLRESQVDELAPAPPGCRSTLDFDRAGTYYVFLETSGSLDPLPGGCPVSGSYETSSVPSPTFALVDAEGVAVPLNPVSSGPTYDEDSGEGTAVREFTIEAPGQYFLDVTGPADGYLARVGTAPGEGTTPWFIGAAASAIVGVLGGLFLLVVGPRGRKPLGVPPPVAVAGPNPDLWPMPQGRPLGPRLRPPQQPGSAPQPPSGWRPLPQPPDDRRR